VAARASGACGKAHSIGRALRACWASCARLPLGDLPLEKAAAPVLGRIFGVRVGVRENQGSLGGRRELRLRSGHRFLRLRQGVSSGDLFICSAYLIALALGDISMPRARATGTYLA